MNMQFIFYAKLDLELELTGYDKIKSRLDRRQARAQSSIQSFYVTTVSFLRFRITYS